MKKHFLISIILLVVSYASFAQQIVSSGKSEFLMIMRFKADFKPSSDEAVKNNIKKWQAYESDLTKAGTLVYGYRPASDGLTISGTEKSLKTSPYIAEGELVSSIWVIKAESMDAAKAIAERCPIFEFGGSVEVRPVIETAR
jgi:hypothetical protein